MSTVKNVKKVIIPLFLLLFLQNFLPLTSHAGSWNGWIYQNPYPTSNTLLAVKFVTPKKGWIAGEHGTILYTEDGGESWEAQESGTEQDIKGIAFINEKVGWAVGNGGTIVYTKDGGKVWQTQWTAKAPLNKVFFLNEKEGWAVGDRGMVLVTKDGGKKWAKQDIGIKQSIVSAYFINSQTGWLLAEGEVHRTKDGGKNWDKSTIPRSDYPRFGAPGAGYIPDMAGDRGDIFFTDDRNGWAVVGFGLIFYTSNGGKTWKNQLHTGPLSYGLSRLSFIDEKRGCAGGSSLLCTEDGGKTWTEKLGVQPGSGKRINHFMVQLQGISFPSQSVGWSVGNEGQIWKTEDAGRTWNLAARRDECGSDVFFISKKTGWFYHNTRDYTTSICRTDNGGLKRQKQEVGIWVWDLFFTDASTGWAVGTIEERNQQNKLEKVYGVIRHTADGGKTWRTQFKELMGNSRFGTGLYGVFFVTPDTGWVVGEKGFILHTTDGGRRWYHQASGSTHYYLRGIRFLDAEIGWVIGTKLIEGESGWTGIILHTQDSGRQWHVQHRKEDAWLNGIFFVDEKTGWVTGNPEHSEYAYLFHAEDGGKSWSETGFTSIGTSYPAFLDNNHGVISGNKGWIAITTDGGKTWVKKRMPLRKQPWHFSELFPAVQNPK